MKLYRFSPIQNQKQLLDVIEHIHFSCFELSRKILGKYLPIAGNIGVFCHYGQEFQELAELSKELTDQANNFEQKYYRLHQPIIISAKGDIPETAYNYLYIRKPDPYRAQAGDVDFVLEQESFKKLKQDIQNGAINGARIFDRPGLEMIELFDPDIDALAYITLSTMAEKIFLK